MEDLETTSDTPMTDALDAAAELHDLADEAASETLAEAAQEAEAVEAVADAEAEVILSEGLGDASALIDVGKPEERAYTHAMDALGVTPRDTWMIGDNLEWEVVAPQRLGIYAIWIDVHGDGLPPDTTVKPDRIIRSLTELVPEKR